MDGGGPTTYRRGRERPQLQWEDCGKRDIRKAEEIDKWREKATVREKWKEIKAGAVQQYMN